MADINILTGDLGDRALNTFREMPLVLVKDTISTYDFYQACSGTAVLPNRCQCYVTVTPNRSSSIGTVAATGCETAEKLFSRLVLPSAHDVDMIDVQYIDIILQTATGRFIEVFKRHAAPFQ